MVAPADPRIALVGRFDVSDPGKATCQWSASEARLRVKGESLVAKIDENGHDAFEVVIDGKPISVLNLKQGPSDYTIDLGSEAVHEVRLVKRTEPFVGTATFLGFEAPNGSILSAPRKRRHIEVVGDSITCGYGNEGANEHEHFKPETENAYESYASIAARQVNADVTILAWSGRKMWPDNTVPEIYDRILPTRPEPLWSYKAPVPDAVVINLATNDFGPSNPDEAKWTGAYEAFIRRVEAHYPHARIYPAIGSMMSDTWPPGRKPLSTLRGYLEHMVARMHDPKIRIVEFDVQKPEDGLGSDWHPNIKTQEKMGSRLAEALRQDLHW
jgi:lysophospholipase L1-like esterase